ncbi:MAG TPA: RodZ domain-containing protein [Burkholderiales bacterium]|nr:RodZ domain-containing protein [Burkholderiales bacterium]
MTDSVGAELARAREERGLSISDVAQQLKFAPRQLEALEQEHFEVLPGGTFVRGMVRSYARLLKLEPEPLLERISGRFAAPDAGTLAARYSQPVPFSDNARRSTFVYLVLSLGVLTISGAVAYSWYREHNQKAQLAAAKRAAPAKSAPTAPRAQPKVVEVAAAPEVVKTDLPPKVTPAKPAVQTVSTIEKVSTEKVETAKVAKPLTGALNRLVIRCEEEAWIEVKDANERMLVSSLNLKGSERVVKARGPLTLVIGNPAQVRVVHNERILDLAPHTKAGVARFTLP